MSLPIACFAVTGLCFAVYWAVVAVLAAPRWWRRWSPWRLRRALVFLKHWVQDDHLSFDDDRRNTNVERMWRYTALVLAGEEEPLAEARRYSVQGWTLHIALPEQKGSTCPSMNSSGN